MAGRYIDFQVKGIKQTIRRLESLARKSIDAMQTGLNDVGKRIEKSSQSMAPVDTGNLKNSAYTIWPKRATIKMPVFKQQGIRRRISANRLRRIRNEHRLIAIEASAKTSAYRIRTANPITQVGHSVFYAEYVHEDETRHPPFLTMALQKHEPEAVPMVAKRVKVALKSAGRLKSFRKTK